MWQGRAMSESALPDQTGETLRRLDRLGVRLGWTCLLVGPGVEDLVPAVRQRTGEQARLVVAGGGPADGQFDFVLARGPADPAPLVERLWFGGILLLEAEGEDGPALQRRLAAAGLEPVGEEPGAASGRRPQFITSY